MSLQALPNSAERMVFEDFSILPPQGDNWCIGALDKTNGAIFYKNQWAGQVLQKRPELWQVRQTLTAIVGADAVKDKINDAESLRKLIMATPTDPRLNIDNVKLVRDETINGAICFKVEGTTIGPLNVSTPDVRFCQNERRLICKHPSRQKIITLEYSERFLETQKPGLYLLDKYQPELEPFIKSLQFRP